MKDVVEIPVTFISVDCCELYLYQRAQSDCEPVQRSARSPAGSLGECPGASHLPLRLICMISHGWQCDVTG